MSGVIFAMVEQNRRQYRYFDLIMTVSVTVLVVSNIASSAKIVDWGVGLFGVPLAFDAGTILFPISYIFGDILTEGSIPPFGFCNITNLHTRLYL